MHRRRPQETCLFLRSSEWWCASSWPPPSLTCLTGSPPWHCPGEKPDNRGACWNVELGYWKWRKCLLHSVCQRWHAASQNFVQVRDTGKPIWDYTQGQLTERKEDSTETTMGWEGKLCRPSSSAASLTQTPIPTLGSSLLFPCCSNYLSSLEPAREGSCSLGLKNP